MIITRGRNADVALKVVIYGPEGIGKSTIASHFPNPVFIDTEGSTDHMDVARTPKPTSWTELLTFVQYFIDHPAQADTLVIDTADWAEKLCTEQLLSVRKMGGIEDFGYGKGYVYLAEEFGKLLNMLEQLRDRGVHVLLTAHAQMRKFEQPDELGDYDRWELKLGKKTSPMVKEWADLLIFANYKTNVVNVDGQGAAKGKNKVTGGRRVMYTNHHPCWDAKNRFDLADELPFEYGAIAHIVRQRPVEDHVYAPTPPPIAAPSQETLAAMKSPAPTADPLQDLPPCPSGIPVPLWALMAVNNVQPFEVQAVVAQKGYYPADTDIGNYDPEFIKGVLVACWPQVEQLIIVNRQKSPF